MGFIFDICFRSYFDSLMSILNILKIVCVAPFAFSRIPELMKSSRTTSPSGSFLNCSSPQRTVPLSLEGLNRKFAYQDWMGRLADKIAIVTGSGAGIGRAAAILFAEEGASVAVLTRSPKHGEETVRMLRGRGGTGTFTRCDVSSSSEIRQAVKG